MVAQLLGVAHRCIDIGGAVDGTRSLQQNGLDLAVLLQLQGEALYPAGIVDGNGILVGQALHQRAGGLQLLLPCGSVHRGDSQDHGQGQGGGPAEQRDCGVMFHGRSFCNM